MVFIRGDAWGGAGGFCVVGACMDMFIWRVRLSAL